MHMPCLQDEREKWRTELGLPYGPLRFVVCEEGGRLAVCCGIRRRSSTSKVEHIDCKTKADLKKKFMVRGVPKKISFTHLKDAEAALPKLQDEHQASATNAGDNGVTDPKKDTLPEEKSEEFKRREVNFEGLLHNKGHDDIVDIGNCTVDAMSSVSAMKVKLEPKDDDFS